MLTPNERARQFLPFTVPGLQEALRDREERHSRVERHEISEEQMELNSEVFLRLTKGMKVMIDCYYKFHDVTFTGTVTCINIPYRFLKLDNQKFMFADIYNIEILEYP